MPGKTYLALCGAVLFSIGCTDQQAVGEERPADQAGARPPPVEMLPPVEHGESPTAERGGPVFQPMEVTLRPASGSSVQGTAILQEVPGGVRVVVDLKQAPPGPRAIHIHERGDCSHPEALSAGDHFAPEGHKHGFPDQPEHHLGDMGNLTVLSDGTARFEIVIDGANLKRNDPKSLLDRAIIVHAEADRGTQPTGDAGGRIACGAIKG